MRVVNATTHDLLLPMYNVLTAMPFLGGVPRCMRQALQRTARSLLNQRVAGTRCADSGRSRSFIFDQGSVAPEGPAHIL